MHWHSAQVEARSLRVSLILTAIAGFLATASAQTATLTCSLNSTTVDRGSPVAGSVTITPASGSGPYDLVVNLNDKSNRTFDRYETRLNVTARTVVPFTLSTANAITLECRIQARGKFVAGTAFGSSTRLTMVPYTIDYDDFWGSVWGGGDCQPTAYNTPLKQANVNLGHIYRGGATCSTCSTFAPIMTSSRTRSGSSMDSASPCRKTLRDTYNTYLLAGNNYGNATARQPSFGRPASTTLPA